MAKMRTLWVPALLALVTACYSPTGLDDGWDFCWGFCYDGRGGGGYTPPPPVLTVTGTIRLGEQPLIWASGREAVIELFDPSDPSSIVADMRHVQGPYRIEFFSGAPLDAICSAHVRALLSNGLVTDAVPVLPDGATCSGVVRERDVRAPAGDPPVTLAGHVYQAPSGVVELYAPGDSANPVHSSRFGDGWFSPPNANYNPLDYATSIGLLPGDPLPPDLCDYRIRAVADDGRTSDLLPAFPTGSDSCEGEQLGPPNLIVW